MKFREWMQQGYGILEEEAFQDKATLAKIIQFSFHKKTQDYPLGSGAEDDPKIWHIHYLSYPLEEMSNIENSMKSGMYDGWYSLLWNDTEVHFVFQKESAVIPNPTGSIPIGANISAIIPVALRHGVQRDQIDLSVLNDFAGKIKPTA